MGTGEVAILVPTDTDPVVSTRVLAPSHLAIQEVADPLVNHLVAFSLYPVLLIHTNYGANG